MFAIINNYIFIPVFIFSTCFISLIHGKRQDYETIGNRKSVSRPLHSRLSFCLDSMIHSFTTRECPGGIRFAGGAPNPDESCYCVDGTFIATGDEFGIDYTIVSGKGNKCYKFNPGNVVKKNEDDNCPTDAALFKWNLVSITDTNNFYEDSVAFWTDPSQLGELKQLRRYKLDVQFNFNVIFGTSETFTGKIAIIRGKNSTLSNVKLGNKCFKATMPSHVYIYNETVLTKGQNYATNIQCDGQEMVEATQIMKRIPDQAQQCSIPTTCFENNATYARIAVPPWASLSDEEKRADYFQANRELIEYRMRMEQQGAHVTMPLSQKLQILNTSQQIFQKAGVRLIDPSIVETAFRLFEYLYHDVDVDDILDPNNLGQILYFLGQCIYQTEEIQYDVHSCPRKAEFYMKNGTRRSKKPGKNPSTLAPTRVKRQSPIPFDKTKIPEDKRFHVENNDPIVELMWKSVDFVYSTCFEDFEYNDNLRHYYLDSMEKLFLLPQVQYRWYRNSTLGMKLYGPIFPQLTQQIMENADFVAGSVHDLDEDFDENWIHKPFLEPDTEDSDDESKIGSTNVTSAYRGYQIWGGLAYCLQLKDFNPGVDILANENAGLVPSLSQLSSALDNGPGKC